jgi:hypothetical protein
VDKKRDFRPPPVFHCRVFPRHSAESRENHGDALVQFLLIFMAESLAISAPAESLLRQRLLLK